MILLKSHLDAKQTTKIAFDQKQRWNSFANIRVWVMPTSTELWSLMKKITQSRSRANYSEASESN